MLAAIHNSIRSLLFDQGRIDPDEVDVRFEMPTRQWIGSLTRPTINLFLFDIEENNDLRSANLQTVRSGNGQVIQRVPPRRFDLHYLVGALTSVVEDEHLLIWRALATLLKHNPLPAELLSDELRALDIPLATRVGKLDDGPQMLDLWRALDLPPRPALLYTVTAPLDLELAVEAPLVLTRTTRFTRTAQGDEAAGHGITPKQAVAIATDIAIGGVVRDRQGVPQARVALSIEGSAAEEVRTDKDGRWILAHVLPGQLRLRVAPEGGPPRPVTIEVPSDSYDITLD